MTSSIIRITAAATAIVAGLAGSAGAASAAQPVRQACVGATFSGAAHSLPPGTVGVIVSQFAQQPSTAHPGLGDGIQMLQAGDVPDTTVVNACND